MGCDLVAVPVANEQFESAAVETVAGRLKEIALTTDTQVSVTLHATNTPATWLFKTREGGMGLVQITGFAENPRAVKIRYKLVQKAAPTQPVATPAGNADFVVFHPIAQSSAALNAAREFVIAQKWQLKGEGGGNEGVTIEAADGSGKRVTFNETPQAGDMSRFTVSAETGAAMSAKEIGARLSHELEWGNVIAATAQNLSFGLQAERDITTQDADDQGLVFFKFKNNDVLKPPFPLKLYLNQRPAFVELTPELKQWIKANDVDVLFHFGEKNWDMMTLEMQEDYTDPSASAEWETVTPGKAVAIFAKKDADHLVRSEVPASSGGSGYRDGLSGVKALRTRSNLMGIYQTRGIDDLSGRGVTIRYKLVQNDKTN